MLSNKKPTVVCLMGPTASGKTSLACDMTHFLNAEIISIDSALIYREMNIGTAKPDLVTQRHYPHHLIDICDPCNTYSVAQCCADVLQLCTEILSRGRTPLLVGGSMMYFNALQQGLAELPTANAAIRAQLLAEAETYGTEFLHKRLATIDPTAALRINPADMQRIQRALEVYALSGETLTTWLQRQTPPRYSWSWYNIILQPTSRAWLHERIAVRLQQMLAQGFVVEACSVIEKWQLTLAHPALRTVGYRQAYDYLQDRYDYATFCAKALSATRQLAKRQLTWLRSWEDALIYPAEVADVLTIVRDIRDLV